MSSPNHIYYDLIQTNLESSDTDGIQCQFNERRNQEFIKNPQDYKFSITRFMIDTPSLPLFRPTIQYVVPEDETNVVSPDLTIYSVTLKLNTAVATNGVYDSSEVSQKFVRWETQDETKTAPNAPYYNSNGLQDNSTGYYNCYSYSWFLRLINSTFERIATELGLASVPILLFDTASNLFVLSAPSDLYDSASDSYYEIYFNKSLYQLFSSFSAVIVSHNSDYGLNYKITTNNFKGYSKTAITTDDSTNTNSLMIYGEYSTLYLWNCVTSIVFTTSNLPIVPAITSNPAITRQGEPISFNTQPNTRRIVTDLVAGNSYKPFLVYNPSAQYRYIDMTQGSPIRDVDIQVFFLDRQGQLNPFKLSPGSTATIKILFEKKVMT